MNNDLSQDAISAALKGNWKEAVKINKEILQREKNDIDALNRLSRAHSELGDLDKAKKIAHKVLKLDPFNSIATKALDKWKSLKKGYTNHSIPSNAQVFLEEPGKTKVASLLYLGDANTIAKLDSGDEVKPNFKAHRIGVSTMDGKYIGRFPDDLSARLRKLTGTGYKYQAYVKSADIKDVKIFIRETKRPNKHIDDPSFPPEKINYVSFTPPELVHKKEQVVFDEEE